MLWGEIFRYILVSFKSFLLPAGPNPAYILGCAVPSRSMSLQGEKEGKICCAFVHSVLKCLLVVRT